MFVASPDSPLTTRRRVNGVQKTTGRKLAVHELAVRTQTCTQHGEPES